MTESARRNILITIVGAVILGVLIMTLRSGMADTDPTTNEVRQTVDPTVLPPVENPMAKARSAEAQPQTTSSEAVTEEPLDSETLVAETEPSSEPAAATEKSNAEPDPAPKPEGVGTVTKLDAAIDGKMLIMTVTCDRPVGDTTYLNLDNPRRLVVDMRQPWTLKAPNVVRLKNGPVKHIVAGNHPDKLRLVIHFNQPLKAKLTPEFQRKGNRLIVFIPLS